MSVFEVPRALATAAVIGAVLRRWLYIRILHIPWIQTLVSVIIGCGTSHKNTTYTIQNGRKYLTCNIRIVYHVYYMQNKMNADFLLLF